MNEGNRKETRTKKERNEIDELGKHISKWTGEMMEEIGELWW